MMRQRGQDHQSGAIHGNVFRHEGREIFKDRREVLEGDFNGELAHEQVSVPTPTEMLSSMESLARKMKNIMTILVGLCQQMHDDRNESISFMSNLQHN